MRRIGLMTAAIVFVAQLAFPATWYVKPAADGGSDSAACTSLETACATVDGAEAKAIAAGDVIQIAPGTYDKDTFGFAARLTKSGTSGNPIIYRGHSGSCATSTSAATRDGLTVSTDLNHPTGSRPAPDVILLGEFNVQAADLTFQCIYVLPRATVGRGGAVCQPGSACRPDAFVISGNDRDGLTFEDFIVDGEATKGNCRYGLSQGGSITAEEDMPLDLIVRRFYVSTCQFGIVPLTNGAIVEDGEVYRPMTNQPDMDYLRGWGNNLTMRRIYAHSASKADCGELGFEDCHIDGFMSFILATDGSSATAILKDAVFDRLAIFNVHQGILLQDLIGRPTNTPSGRIDGVSITNSIFAHDPLTNEGMPWGIVLEAVENIAAHHNTIVCEGGNSSAGIGYRTGSTGAAQNNVIVDCGNNPASVDASSSATTTPNFAYDPTKDYSSVTFPGWVLDVDPLFVNEAIGDFDLGDNSPAIDACATDLGIAVDFKNVSRDATPDCGAYEGEAPTDAAVQVYRRLRIF